MLVPQAYRYGCFIELTLKAGIGGIDMLVVNEMIGQVRNRLVSVSDQLVKIDIVIAAYPAGLHAGIKMEGCAQALREIQVSRFDHDMRGRIVLVKNRVTNKQTIGIGKAVLQEFI